MYMELSLIDIYEQVKKKIPLSDKEQLMYRIMLGKITLEELLNIVYVDSSLHIFLKQSYFERTERMIKDFGGKLKGDAILVKSPKISKKISELLDKDKEIREAYFRKDGARVKGYIINNFEIFMLKYSASTYPVIVIQPK